jgi:GT2 family glycosyltransferase
MKSPLVSVIIVNWNGANVINDCLSLLIKQSYKPVEIIVVDNNSSDESRKIIKKYKRVTLIENKYNSGFAEGNNIGYKKAKGKYILLLNSDTIPANNFLEKLVNFLEKKPDVGIVQPKVFYENKTINSLGAYLTTTGFLYYPCYGKYNSNNYNNPFTIFTAYGACMLIRREVIEKIGLFDKDYFMYFEETDFCMRAWLYGWKIMCIPNVSIVHKGGVSSKKFGLEKIYFHSFKNRICTYLKNLEFWSLLKIVPLHLLICEAISIIYILRGQVSYSLSVQKAIFWNIRYLSSTVKKRADISNFRGKHDKEYFSTVLKNPRLSYYLYLFKGLQYYKD